jgi:hypothetical protein
MFLRFVLRAIVMRRLQNRAKSARFALSDCDLDKMNVQRVVLPHLALRRALVSVFGL